MLIMFQSISCYEIRALCYCQTVQLRDLFHAIFLSNLTKASHTFVISKALQQFFLKGI